MKKLGLDFYNRANVLQIARELIGKILVTVFEEGITSGRIVEVEAYNGVDDKASHAYGGRRTHRTEIMYGRAGTAYVFLCYGIHHLFNIVTNREGIPHAILIRAVEPIEGIEIMKKRLGVLDNPVTLASGPGKLSRALGIRTFHTGTDLLGKKIYLGDDGFRVNKVDLLPTERIGVEYAKEDAKLAYRMILLNSPYVSGRKLLKRNS